MSEQPERQIPFGRPIVTDDDRAAVLAALDSPVLTHGPRCQSFEDDFAAFMGGGHSVTTSSCTAALHLFNMHLGVGPGDKVIVPAISHVATAHALEITGATPVFVDCDTDTGNMDPDALAAAIDSDTKAICMVHFNGIPADMTAIMAVAEKHGLPVLEDCATSLGGTWDGTHVGLFGDGAAFSFYPAKHITSAEGGMFSSRHGKVAASVKRIRGFCYDRSLNERKLPGIYDVDGLGMNFRMSELHAALGASQLKRAPDFLAARGRNFAAYKSLLPADAGFRILEPVDARSKNSFYCLTVLLENPRPGLRDDLLSSLPARGVGVSVHYPHPLPRLAYYREKYGYVAGMFPNAEAISDRSVNLPLGPHISDDDIAYIANTFVNLLRELNT